MVEPLVIWAIIREGHWQAGIGDPSVIGWLTVVAYLVTALLCSVCGILALRVPYACKLHRHRWLWWSLALILLLLGINKQLDLQSWFTAVSKQLALSQGWYQQRRTVQREFIIGLIFAALILVIFLGEKMGTEWKKFRLPLLGLIFLCSFIIVRATSFHHVDQMLGWQLARWRINWLLELGGIACIAGGAMNYLRRH